MKLNLYKLTVLLLFIPYLSFAQSETFRFANALNCSSIRQMEVDSVGNIYVIGEFFGQFEYQGEVVTGNTELEKGSPGDLFVLKTTPSGSLVYLHSIHGTDFEYNRSNHKMTINNAGEMALYYEIGPMDKYIVGNRSFSFDSQRTEYLIAKFSKTGLLCYESEISAYGDSEIEASDIELDESGNLYVAGSFIGTHLEIEGETLVGEESIYKIFVQKFNPDGSVKWLETCDHVADSVDGGGIYINDIEILPSSEVCVSGYYTGYTPYYFNNDQLRNYYEGQDAYVALFSEDGAPVWAKSAKGYGIEVPLKLSVNNDRIAWACSFNSSYLSVGDSTFYASSGYSVFVANLNSNGDFLWCRDLDFSTPESANEQHFYISLLANDNTKIVGDIPYSDNQSWWYILELASSDASFEPNYILTAPSNSLIDDVEQDKSGETVLIGHTYEGFYFFRVNPDSEIIDSVSLKQGYRSEFLCKFTPDNNIEYLFQRENKDNDEAGFLELGTDGYGNAFVAGEFVGQNVFLDEIELTDGNNQGFFITEYAYLGSIVGNVYGTDFEPRSGMVTLLGYTYYQKSPVSDSLKVGEDGVFQFTNVPEGKYILRFVPDDENCLVTYASQEGIWEEATQYVLNGEEEVMPVTIFVQDKVVLDGEATLSGKITTIEEEDVFKGTQAKPKRKGQASLATSKKTKSTTSDYDIIAKTYSDESGYFQFANVPDGEYTIFIDEAGLPNVDPHTVHVINGSFISNINYYIDEETVTGTDNPTAIQVIGDGNSLVKMYPNPSQGDITIESDNGMESVIITNLQGKVIRQFVDTNSNIYIEDLNEGIYIVKLKANNKDYISKLVVY